jgi:hypothetical protein
MNSADGTAPSGNPAGDISLNDEQLAVLDLDEAAPPPPAEVAANRLSQPIPFAEAAPGTDSSNHPELALANPPAPTDMAAASAAVVQTHPSAKDIPDPFAPNPTTTASGTRGDWAWADFRDTTISVSVQEFQSDLLDAAAPQRYEVLTDLENDSVAPPAEAAAAVFVELADLAADGAPFGAFPWPAAVLVAAACEIARRQLRRSAEGPQDMASSPPPDTDGVPGLFPGDVP